MSKVCSGYDASSQMSDPMVYSSVCHGVAVSYLGDLAMLLMQGPVAVGRDDGLQCAVHLTVHSMPQYSVTGPCSWVRDLNVLREDAAIELQDCE